jgi:hypothetical protein
MSVLCKSCNKEFSSEYEGEIGEGTICPHCNESLSKLITLRAEIGTFKITGGTANLTVTTYPEILLIEVEDLINRQKFSLAVVVAQMACEISSERALTRAFADKGFEYLEDSIGSLLPSRSIANERVRKLYDALTDGNIYDDLKHIWQNVKDLAALRNAAVHRGKVCSKAEVEAALATATEIVKYFKH